MRLELTGRHLTITPAIRKLVTKALAPTLRVLNDNALSAQVVVTREKASHRAEVTVHARGENFLHGAGTGRAASEAMSAAMAKIDRQVEKLKGKWEGRKRRKAPAMEVPVVPDKDATQDVRIIRARRYAVKPLSIDD